MSETDEPTVYGRETDRLGRAWDILSRWDVPAGTVVPPETFRASDPDCSLSRGTDGVTRVNVLTIRRLVPTPPKPVFGVSEVVFRRTPDGWEREV